MVALGVVVALSKAISERHLYQALAERIKPDYLELNQKAVEKGIELVSRPT